MQSCPQMQSWAHTVATVGSAWTAGREVLGVVSFLHQACHVCLTLTPAGAFLVIKPRALDGRVTSVWPPCHSQQPGSESGLSPSHLELFWICFSSTLHP